MSDEQIHRETKPFDDAFPCSAGQQGLTKREYFAAAALACLSRNALTVNELSREAVFIADQLIFRLNKRD
jgi:hypothetical protein